MLTAKVGYTEIVQTLLAVPGIEVTRHPTPYFNHFCNPLSYKKILNSIHAGFRQTVSSLPNFLCTHDRPSHSPCDPGAEYIV